MKLTHMGHAGWLIEEEGLRILIDPLLAPTHHVDVFRVHPNRTIHIQELAPDFIIISHAHPDHFDIHSLGLLSQYYPNAIVFSADPLVVQSATIIGFKQAFVLAHSQCIDLQVFKLYTTQSYCHIQEWGILLHSKNATVWNQVDSVHRSPKDIQRNLQLASKALHLTAPIQLDLVIAQWQPILQVQALTGTSSGFPFAAYHKALQNCAATNTKHLIPGASGTHHEKQYDWLNRWVYPVSETSFLQDMKNMAPAMNCISALPGDIYQIVDHKLHKHPTTSTLVTPIGTRDQRRFQPVSIPQLHDPNPHNQVEETMLIIIEEWIEAKLQPALFDLLCHRPPISLVLSVVFPSFIKNWSFSIKNQILITSKQYNSDYSQLNIIAASYLVDVITAKSHWGRPLLAGMMRTVDRGYVVNRDGLKRIPLPAFFLYCGLSYRQSVTYWTAWQLQEKQWLNPADNT